MAWRSYYINIDKLVGLNEIEEDICIMYNSNVPPHGGIRREWTTRGLKHGSSKILFVEYQLEDDDPDGVWEAYGQKRASEYSFTVNAEDADPEKLFVYTLYKDGSIGIGFDIDTIESRAIFVFANAQSFTAEQLSTVAEKAETAPRVTDAVEEIVINDLLYGSKNTICLAFFNW